MINRELRSRLTIAFFASGLIAVLSAGLIVASFSWPWLQSLAISVLIWIVSAVIVFRRGKELPTLLATFLMVLYPVVALLSVFLALSHSPAPSEDPNAETVESIKSDLAEQTGKLRSQLDSAASNSEKLSQELRKSKEEVDRLAEIGGDRQAEFDALKKEFETAIGLADKLTEDLAAANSARGAMESQLASLTAQLDAALRAADTATATAQDLAVRLQQCEDSKLVGGGVTVEGDSVTRDGVPRWVQILVPVLGPILGSLLEETEYREKVLPVAEAIKNGEAVSKDQLKELIDNTEGASDKLKTLRLLAAIAEHHNNQSVMVMLGELESELELAEAYVAELSEPLRNVFNRLGTEPAPTVDDIKSLLPDGKYLNPDDKNQMQEMLFALFRHHQSLWEGGLKDLPVLSQ